MSAPGRPVAEADLHALADGFAAPERRSAIMDHLEADPEEARRVADWCTQNEAIRRAFGKAVSAPLPAALTLTPTAQIATLPERPPQTARAAPRRRTTLLPRIAAMRPAARAAAILAGLLVGAGSGWVGAQAFSAWRSASEATRVGTGRTDADDPFAERAAEAHQVYAEDPASPVEVPARDKGRLLRWIAERTGVDEIVPDLQPSGYAFLGGRIVPSNLGPAAMFVFDGAGRRISLVVGHASHLPQASLRYREIGGTGSVAWASGNTAFAVSGAADEDLLSRTAMAIMAAEARRARTP